MVRFLLEKLYTKYLAFNESHHIAMRKLRVPIKSYNDLDVNVLVFGIFLGIIIARFEYFVISIIHKNGKLFNTRKSSIVEENPCLLLVC
jgi:hypothetical protein